MHQKTPIISFYSYKGGTGRTTATANTAAILASRGKKVVCIDMDLEGPGLAIVFGQENPPPTLQEYLLKKDSRLENMIVDVTSSIKGFKKEQVGTLQYIPSGNDFRETINYSDGRRLIRDMERLFTMIADTFNPDLILLDSPSGYGELSALSMYLSSCLVVVFRLSLQHILGTVRVLDFVTRFGLKQIPIASCVPETDPEKMKHGYLELLQQKLGLVEKPHEIRDSDYLKWQERVILFDEKRDKSSGILKDYIKVADKIESAVL